MYCMLKSILEMAIMFVLLAVCDFSGIKKYIIVGAVSAFLLFIKRKERWRADLLICISIPAMTYLITGIVGSLVNANIYNTTLKVVLFWIIPLVFSFSLYVFYREDMPHIVDIQFWASCLAYIVNNGKFIVKFFCVESTFAFAFGAFFIYYVYKKSWAFCAIAALFMYLADKRIAILAVLVAVATMVFLKLFRNDKRLAFTIWGMITFAVNFYVWLICSGTLETLCKAVGIDTSGRVKIYGQTVKWFEQEVLFLGNGLGIVEIILDAWNIKEFSNLHNDLLKFYIELGIVGLLLFLLSYGAMFFLIEKEFGDEKMCFFLVMTVYSIVLYATDNVSIYILYLIPIYSIFFSVLAEKRKRINTKDVT